MLFSGCCQPKPSLNLLAFTATWAKQDGQMTMLKRRKIKRDHLRTNLQAFHNNFSLYLSEQFQFVSQRHRGFPFSATLYVNGMMVARISSCCEYRYAPGFQQGRKSCFRLSWLAGGIPCYRSDFILWETDSAALAENLKLVPVKTDW